MIKYLIIQLDDTSVSYCHYPALTGKPRLISLDDLRAGILWAMKENVTVQFVYPSYRLPDEYHRVIESIDHADIVPAGCEDTGLLDKADVIVLDGMSRIASHTFRSNAAYVLRTSKEDLLTGRDAVAYLLDRVMRLNVVITDVETFTDDDTERYGKLLGSLAEAVAEQYAAGRNVQFNLLTDRLMLDRMNNCNAGWETIALAPDGRFYPCPAFYGDADKGYNIGDLHSGPDIKNPQLYRLDHAPICRRCDAWQCRRCTWLNCRLTLEVNTPGHQQCIMTHVERNASRRLLPLFPGTEIPEIGYLDPFDIAKN